MTSDRSFRAAGPHRLNGALTRTDNDPTRLTKTGQEPNGIKLAAELVLYQLLMQCLPGYDHKGEALRPPFLDAGLHAMGSYGVDDQGY